MLSAADCEGLPDEELIAIAEGKGSYTLGEIVKAKAELTKRELHWAGNDCWCNPRVQHVGARKASR